MKQSKIGLALVTIGLMLENDNMYMELDRSYRIESKPAWERKKCKSCKHFQGSCMMHYKKYVSPKSNACENYKPKK